MSRESIRAVELWNCGIVELERYKKSTFILTFSQYFPSPLFVQEGQGEGVFSLSYGAVARHEGLSWKLSQDSMLTVTPE